jgi:phospholipid-transporting ATPase
MSRARPHDQDPNQPLYNNQPPPRGKLCFKERVPWDQYPDRTVVTNQPDLQVPNNEIHTSKYTVLNFFPKNIFEQFSKMANMYFLFIGFLQMINEISTSNGVPVTWGPLSVIILISMIKDIFEDLKRHKADSEENNRPCLVLKDGRFTECRWRDLRIGDIVKITQNQFFPADILVLQTSENKNLCYIETKNLDGETNLKHKQAHKDFNVFLGKSESEVEPKKKCFAAKKIRIIFLFFLALGIEE